MHLKVSRLPDPLHAADEHNSQDDTEDHAGGVTDPGHEAKQAGGRGQEPGGGCPG